MARCPVLPYCDECLDTKFWCDDAEDYICDCPAVTAKAEAEAQLIADMEHDRIAA
jgi:hypothetical protein